MAIGGVIKIEYTGASASCLLTGDAVAHTLTSRIGAAGAEAVDAAFGTAGVLDLTGATVDTLAELAVVIEAYANYSCSILYNDAVTSANIASQTVQAKGSAGYVVFDLSSSVLSSVALTTWARYQAILGTTLAPNSDQTLVEYLINSVSEQGEMLAGGRRLKSRTYGPTGWTPYIFDGNGRNQMPLPAWPIVSVTNVYLDSTRAWGTDTIVDPADYTYDKEAGILIYPDNVWSKGVQNMRVDYVGGFSTVKDYIQMATIEAVVWTRNRFRNSTMGARSASGPNGITSSYEIEMPMNARKVFEDLRDRRI